MSGARRRVSEASGFGRVAVLMGGYSAEREVSLWSGKAVLDALLARGVDAHAIDLTREGMLRLHEQSFDRAFNVVHGTGGEDGRLRALLELMGVPSTGSGVLASALAMDKLATKRIWKAEGLPTPDFLRVPDLASLEEAARALGYPLIVKPAEEGSSVGITKVMSDDGLAAAFASASGPSARSVMAERFVDGGARKAEFTCAILGDQALPIVRIEPDGEFYDYHAKYVSDRTQYHCPAGLDSAQEADLQALCARAFQAIGAQGWGRIDFMLDARGQAWLIEANLVPGMTSHSLVPMAARTAGIDFSELCWRILELASGGRK